LRCISARVKLWPTYIYIHVSGTWALPQEVRECFAKTGMYARETIFSS
jgi:hypothetical protein